MAGFANLAEEEAADAAFAARVDKMPGRESTNIEGAGPPAGKVSQFFSDVMNSVKLAASNNPITTAQRKGLLPFRAMSDVDYQNMVAHVFGDKHTYTQTEVDEVRQGTINEMSPEQYYANLRYDIGPGSEMYDPAKDAFGQPVEEGNSGGIGLKSETRNPGSSLYKPSEIDLGGY